MAVKEQDIKDLENKLQELALDSNSNTFAVTALKESVDKLEVKVDGFSEKLDQTKEGIIKSVREEFVTLTAFQPIKVLVYGLVGGVLSTVLFAILALVVTPMISQDILNRPPQEIHVKTSE